MKHTFKIGDRVIVNDTGKSDAYRVNEKTGTIVSVRTGGYDVNFDEDFGGHSCGGLAPYGHGWFVSGSDLELVKEEKKMSKFSVGDKVMFRFMDDMIQEFGRSGSIIIGPDGQACNIEGRRHICGRTAIIESIRKSDRKNMIFLKNWSDTKGDMVWDFTDWMFCLVEKAKPAPEKKKLTVAEVEKLLGYGVEVVRG